VFVAHELMLDVSSSLAQQQLAALANGLVPLEYSIGWLTCTVASRLDAVMVG
jgi:hypothetical protein